MRRLGVVAVVLALVAGAVALVVTRNGGGSGASAKTPHPGATVTGYLADWTKGDYTAMRAIAYQAPPSFVAQHRAMVDALGAANLRFTAGRVTTNLDDTQATAPFTATMRVRGFGRWSYTGRLTLVRVIRTENGTVAPAEPGDTGGRWEVAWSPSTLHPRLRVGLGLAVTRTWPQRASILDGNGNVLVGTGAMVQIGVEPRAIKDLDATALAFQQQLQVPVAVFKQKVAAAHPDWFVEFATMPRGPQYDRVRDVLYPIPGTRFVTKEGRVYPANGFARAVLGSTHEATAEDLKNFGAPYQQHDVVGASGVERTYERQLAGTPSGDIRIVNAKTKKLVEVLKRFTGTKPANVTITIDPTIQAAAEAAIATAPANAALVAIDVPSGEVRAVANNPLDGFDRALEGHYPPGSTFKIVTSTAVLSTGGSTATTISCPAALTIGGRTLHNAEGEASGPVPFRTAFAESCNNAFVQLAERAGIPAMESAAAAYGFNTEYNSGLSHFGGSYPHPKDVVELAESSIGQGRVDASPMHMASVAAAVARGQWTPPVVVRGVQQPPAFKAPAALAPPTANTLRDFMVAVVQPGGTAAAVDFGGREVHGKTGTAEFGDNTQTHAWFVGYSGNVAFAVVVEAGGFGGKVAAPIAARFLTALPR
jgi:cell division protein FtsI/penicillin-binding protein 2